MRHNGSSASAIFSSASERIRPVLAALTTHARSSLARLDPYWDRFKNEARKHPRIAAGIDMVTGAWTTLIDSFCTMIDPILSRFFPDLRFIAVVTASGDVELHAIAKGGTRALGSLAMLGDAARSEIVQTKWTAVELRLQPAQLLHRTLSLPAASRDFLGPIIEHRLERLTPWRPDRVLYGYKVLEEQEAGGCVSVALTATSKDFVSAPLHALGEVGLVPTAIGASADPLTEPLRVNLLRDAGKRARIDSRHVVSRVALSAFAILALSYTVSSLWADNAMGRQKEAAVKLLKARRLLKTASMGAIGEREQALLDAKQPERAVVILVDKLATAIPQDTYLKELVVMPDKVRLAGVSGNAPALIGNIEKTGLVNVRFGAAVTREKSQKDSFEITADRSTANLAVQP